MEKPSNPKWKVLESEYLAREPWLTLRRDRIESVHGAVIPAYYVLEYPDWVNVLARTRDDRFVLVSQYRHGLGESGYELCAGVREPSDATPEQAARRELLEETGFGGGRWSQYMVLSANPASTSNLTYTFLAEDVEPVGEQHLDPTEELSVLLLDQRQLADLLLSGSIRQALHAAPLWKYAAENGWLKGR